MDIQIPGKLGEWVPPGRISPGVKYHALEEGRKEIVGRFAVLVFVLWCVA